MYKKVDSFIADITASNYFKDNPHLVDKLSIYRWVKNDLKKFGTQIMQKRDAVIHIKNFRGECPDDFGQLSLAVHCDLDSIYVNGNKDLLLQSRIYVERSLEQYLEDRTYFNFNEKCDDCTPTEKYTEKVYLEGGSITFNYKNPRYVKLGRDILRGGCTESCINRQIQDSPYSINIKGKTVHAMFNKGSIYMEYYALPQNEDGLPVIPSTDKGYLEEFLEYSVKRRILEDAIMSKDSPNLVSMFQYYVQKENALQGKAKADVNKLNMQTLWKAIDMRRKNNTRYNVNLGKR